MTNQEIRVNFKKTQVIFSLSIFLLKILLNRVKLCLNFFPQRQRFVNQNQSHFEDNL